MMMSGGDGWRYAVQRIQLQFPRNPYALTQAAYGAIRSEGSASFSSIHHGVQ